MVAPGIWSVEAPATPYSPNVRWSGAMVSAAPGKTKAPYIPTDADRERAARAHAAYKDRQRQLRLLTARQREVLAAVHRHAGNRTRAAGELGVTIASVQHTLRLIVRAGIPIPDGARRGPDLRQRRRAA